MEGQAFPFDTVAWLKDEAIRTMCVEARAAYVHLLAYSWLEDGTPADSEALRRLADLSPKEWKKAWQQLAAHWPVDSLDGRRRNPRQERDRDALLATLAKRGAASQVANDARRAVRSRSESVTDPVAAAVTGSVVDRKLNGAFSDSDSMPERTVFGSSSLAGTQLGSLTPKGVVPQVFGSELQTEPFGVAWARWCEHLRAKRGREITFSRDELATLGARLRGWGHDGALAAIEHSIGSGWASIQAPSGVRAGSDRDPNRSPNRNRSGGQADVLAEFEKAFPGHAQEVARG
jgi:uncharacterized protein YdaU (DUF1376 family)